MLRAWQNSTELVRDYQAYAHELEEDNKELGKLFSEFAEDEAVHAAKFLDPLRGYEKYAFGDCINWRTPFITRFPSYKWGSPYVVF